MTCVHCLAPDCCRCCRSTSKRALSAADTSIASRAFISRHTRVDDPSSFCSVFVCLTNAKRATTNTTPTATVRATYHPAPRDSSVFFVSRDGIACVRGKRYTAIYNSLICFQMRGTDVSVETCERCSLYDSMDVTIHIYSRSTHSTARTTPVTSCSGRHPSQSTREKMRKRSSNVIPKAVSSSVCALTTIQLRQVLRSSSPSALGTIVASGEK